MISVIAAWTDMSNGTGVFGLFSMSFEMTFVSSENPGIRSPRKFMNALPDAFAFLRHPCILRPIMSRRFLASDSMSDTSSWFLDRNSPNFFEPIMPPSIPPAFPDRKLAIFSGLKTPICLSISGSTEPSISRKNGSALSVTPPTLSRTRFFICSVRFLLALLTKDDILFVTRSFRLPRTVFLSFTVLTWSGRLVLFTMSLSFASATFVNTFVILNMS